MTPPRRILVTRPQPEADRWVGDLRAHGLGAEALPLIGIRAAPSPALRQAQARWQQYSAIMVVSGNAAAHFFDQNWHPALAAQAPAAIKTRVWAPGPGTAATLQRLGVPPALIDMPDAGAAQFESETLWQRVRPQVVPGSRVLIVRGTDAESAGSAQGRGREWLADQLRQAGATVDFVVAYERAGPTWTEALHAQAASALAPDCCWIFSSSEAVMHLRHRFDAAQLARAQALATHPRIVQAALDAGFHSVQPCRPALADVLASLESMA
ncbi:hypothetical protein GCM10027082_21880 [Comamonas humi]